MKQTVLITVVLAAMTALGVAQAREVQPTPTNRPEAAKQLFQQKQHINRAKSFFRMKEAYAARGYALCTRAERAKMRYMMKQMRLHGRAPYRQGAFSHARRITYRGVEYLPVPSAMRMMRHCPRHEQQVLPQ